MYTKAINQTGNKYRTTEAYTETTRILFISSQWLVNPEKHLNKFYGCPTLRFY